MRRQPQRSGGVESGKLRRSRGSAGTQTRDGSGERSRRLLAPLDLLGRRALLGWRLGAGTLELALQLVDSRPEGMVIALEGGAQFGGDALQRGDASPQALATLVHRGEASGERVSLLLGVLCGGLCLLGATLPVVELGAPATTSAHGGLLGLDAQLLLCVLALLDSAQLQLALGQLHGGALPHALALGLAPAQIGEVSLKRAHRRLSRLGATQQGRIAQPRTAGTALGERVLFLLVRGTFAPRLVFLRDHHHSEYGRDRTGFCV